MSSQTRLAHGRASGPTSALSHYVLGVRPYAPGYKQRSIKPQVGNLTRAVGEVPTPYGVIAVKWGVSAGGAVSMNVTVPNGTTGTIAIPSGATVTMNGKTVTTSASSNLDEGAAAMAASMARSTMYSRART